MVDVAPGWYSDPWGHAALRYWDGVAWTHHVDPGPDDLGSTRAAMGMSETTSWSAMAHGRPSPRLCRTPQDFESVAAEWMQCFGFRDARCTPPGADGGIDVESVAAVAQVKAHQTPIGRPTLQQLSGVALASQRRAIFFSLMSYTRDAELWAAQSGMALFRFSSYDGAIEPVNSSAADLLNSLGGAAATPPSFSPNLPAPPPPAATWFAATLAPEVAVSSLRRQAKGLLNREGIQAVYLAWMPVVPLDITVTIPSGRRKVQAKVHRVFVDTATGAPIPSFPRIAAINPPADQSHLLWPTGDLRRGERVIAGLWKKASSLKTPEGRLPYEQGLMSYGISRGAQAYRLVPAVVHQFPAYLGLLGNSQGQRIAAISAITGTSWARLSDALTLDIAVTRDLLEHRSLRVG